METAHHEPAFEAPSVEELQPLFPSYAIEQFIAQGGMGAVYKARQTSLDRPVALKILPPEFGDDPQFRASFQAEAKAMARLNHPNLIAVYDFGDVEGMLFIIMEYVDGASLHYSAHGQAIEQTEAARLAAGICRGLAHAHQAHILHRDIKPANILLTASAQPKIGDFGLARPVGHHDGEEAIFGTPGYSAPEVLNHPERVDQRADIYSTGVILYELLTGRLPGDTWQPPSSVAGTNPAFDAIVRRAMHPSPEMRYSDADQIATELEQAAGKIQGPLVRRAGGTAAAAGPRRGAPVSGARPVRTVLPSSTSSGFPAWAVVLLLLVVAGMAAFVVVGMKGDPPKAPAAAAPQNPPKPDPKVAVVTPPRETPRPERKDPNPVRDRPRPEDSPGPKTAANDRPQDRPMRDRNPEPAPEPAPEPMPDPKDLPPAFDTAAFIDKGRGALIRKAEPLLAEHGKELVRNIERFERKLERVVRRLDRRFREDAEAMVEAVVERTRPANRLTQQAPEKIPRFFEDFEADVKEAYAETLEDQEQIDQELATKLDPLRDAYLAGISRQVDLLRKENDPAAIEILEAELSATKDSLPRFVRILRGEDPDPEEEPAADGEGQ